MPPEIEPVFTYADIDRLLNEEPPELTREREYRRGYVDGWIQAIDALHDLLFQYRLSRQQAYDVAWNHAIHGELLEWKRHPENGSGDWPPRHPKPEKGQS